MARGWQGLAVAQVSRLMDPHVFGTANASFSGMDAGIKLRPNAEELEEIGPEFENRWKTYFANAPDKPVMLSGPLTA